MIVRQPAVDILIEVVLHETHGSSSPSSSPVLTINVPQEKRTPFSIPYLYYTIHTSPSFSGATPGVYAARSGNLTHDGSESKALHHSCCLKSSRCSIMGICFRFGVCFCCGGEEDMVLLGIRYTILHVWYCTFLRYSYFKIRRKAKGMWRRGE